MERSQKAGILKDLERKLVFIVGPRQVGKTWLAKEIGAGFAKTVYLNYDRIEDRKVIRGEGWLKSTELLILDEIHKMRGWKGFIKGVFDTRPARLRILVTGSARLDALRQTGDSLAGRFFTHRLMPFSPAELAGTPHAADIDRFMVRGGFPEPFLAEEAREADRWRLQYVDGLVKTDIFDVGRIHDLRAIQLVLELLRRKVGSPVSFASIAGDVQVAPNTVRKYLQILEALYIVFRVAPHSQNVARSLMKDSKVYFYDTGMVLGEPGAVFENMAAVCLLKHVLGKTDHEGKRYDLRYIRTKEKREVDFCVTCGGRPEFLVETKLSDNQFSRELARFARALGVPGFQVVKELKQERREGALEMRAAETYFGELFR